MLVQGNSQNRRIIPPDILRTIPVMHVPVQNGDTIQTQFFASVRRGHRGVIENAKAHCPGTGGMVTRRVHQRIAIADFPADHFLDHLNGATRGKHGNFKATIPHGGYAIARIAAGWQGADTLHVFQMLGRMNTQNILVACRLGLDAGQMINLTGGTNQLVKAALRIGMSQVVADRLQTGTQISRGKAARPGIYPAVKCVPNISCCHVVSFLLVCLAEP